MASRIDQKLMLASTANTIERLQDLQSAGDLNGWSVDIPQHVYHNGPGIGSGGLKKIFRSAKRYKYELENPREETDALVIGTALHCALLEPDKYGDLYCVKPLGTDRRTKVGKEAYEKFEAANQGKTVLHHEDAEMIAGMSKSLAAHGKLANMLGGEHYREMTCYFSISSKVVCRTRKDLYLPETATICDVKTTQDASKNEFRRAIANLGYDIQAAYYLDVAKNLGLPAKHYLFAVVEKTPPYESVLYYLKDRTIDAGRRRYLEALDIYERCVTKGVWPGLADDIVEIEAPEWHLQPIEQNLEVEEFV